MIAPCFNEQGNVAPLVERTLRALEQAGVDGELVLVNDGSSDGTARQIDEAAANSERVQAVHHAQNSGIVAGWRSGVLAARGELVATIDADMQYRPEDVPLLLARFERGDVDVVQGRREQQPERSALRRVMTAGLSWLLNLIFGTKLRDNKSGFILASRAVWLRILATSEGLRYFQHFIGIAVTSLGLRIAQVSIVFDPRFAGQSFITSPLRFALKSLVDLPLALWRFRIVRRRLRKS
ncbi:MAG: glycosyltransferase family 2 protein [Candidatus Alcyoniella australis]|nr:glycosyltransferase family 2 protein [Candidatus Alcyoniella australis]